MRLLNIQAINPTFQVHCTQGSSNIPERRTSSVLNIENMSIFPMTLKLGLCINFSTWSGLKLKGYCTPAFRVGSLSRALTKSLSTPPQHTIVGSVDTTLSNDQPLIHCPSPQEHLYNSVLMPSSQGFSPPRNTDSDYDQLMKL